MRQVNGRTADVFPVVARCGLKLTLFFVLCVVQMVTLGAPTSVVALAG